MIRKKPIDYDKALLKMSTLCARAEHCEAEIREKLRRLGLASADINRAIDYLVSYKFIDNARFARAYASDKARFSGYGKMKIKMGLMSKHIPSSLIADALDSLDMNMYKDTLMKVARLRSKSLELNIYEDRAKLYRRLISRGYESSLVTEAISLLRKEAENNDSQTD